MSLRGLGADEAARRLARVGPNALPAPRGRGLLRFFVEVLEERPESATIEGERELVVPKHWDPATPVISSFRSYQRSSSS